MKLDTDSIRGMMLLIGRYCQLKYMVFPDDPVKLVWDILIIVALLYICFVVPYEISFNSDNAGESTTQLILTLVIDILYGIDIIINLFSAYVDE